MVITVLKMSNKIDNIVLGFLVVNNLLTNFITHSFRTGWVILQHGKDLIV